MDPYVSFSCSGPPLPALQLMRNTPTAGDYSPPGEAVVIGEGDFRYRLVPGWATQNAANYKLGNCNAIAQDSRGRILLLHTSKEHCLIALSPEGMVLDAWGDFTVAAHGLSVVKEKEREVLFISDHSAGGKVYKTTLDGEVLMTISCPMESALYKTSGGVQAGQDAAPARWRIFRDRWLRKRLHPSL